MIEFEWDRRDLENQLLLTPFQVCGISLHLIINDVDISIGFFTEGHFFFPSLHQAIIYLDPDQLSGKTLESGPYHMVTVGSFEFSVSFVKDDDRLLDIEYESLETLKLMHLTVPYRDFIESSLEANQRFLSQCLEIRPDLVGNEYFIRMNHDFNIIRNWYSHKWRHENARTYPLYPKYDPRILIDHEFHLPDGKGIIPWYKEDYFFIEGRYIDIYVGPGKPGTTFFPVKESHHYHGKTNPGSSELTKEGVIQLLTDALMINPPPWPTPRTYTHTVTFPEERYGIKEMEIRISPKGIENVYPTKGSQIFKWYDGRWNPCPEG